MCEIMSFGFVCKMYAVGLWMSFSSSNRQLSFALFKSSYLNWHEISVVHKLFAIKVSHGMRRERSFHFMQKSAKYFRRLHLLHPLLLTGHILNLCTC